MKDKAPDPRPPVPEHEILMARNKELIAELEGNVDRLRQIRGDANQNLNEAESMLAQIASGAPKPARAVGNSLR